MCVLRVRCVCINECLGHRYGVISTSNVCEFYFLWVSFDPISICVILQYILLLFLLLALAKCLCSIATNYIFLFFVLWSEYSAIRNSVSRGAYYIDNYYPIAIVLGVCVKKKNKKKQSNSIKCMYNFLKNIQIISLYKYDIIWSDDQRHAHALWMILELMLWGLVTLNIRYEQQIILYFNRSIVPFFSPHISPICCCQSLNS